MSVTTVIRSAYLVPWTSGALTGEGLGNPRVLVCPVPNGDSYATSDTLAGAYDSCVVRLLLLEQSGRRRKLHANVELCNGNLDTSGGKALKILLDSGWELADNKVALEANAVERDILRLEGFNEVEHCGRLRAGALDVVVVDVEFRTRIRSTRSVESNLDVGSAEGVVENIGTPSTIIIERL